MHDVARPAPDGRPVALAGEAVPLPGPGLGARVGAGLWRLFTSVDFAVVQLIVLAVMGTIGMTFGQLPGFAFRDPNAYADEMAKLHGRYDPVLGAGAVGVLERLGAFQVFGSWWFSLALVVLLLSIVICTIDRLPRIWAAAHEVRVVQPDAYFDPRLPGRALTDGLDEAAVEAALRRGRFRVRRASLDGTTYLYGDRNQYAKLATVFTHIGLVLFLVAAAVTSRFGFEAPLVVTNGGVSTVQAIGTPGLLVARNNGFQAPRTASGAFADFSTDLSIFREGTEIARKTIRVNDPLTVAGFTFHQNGFGPAPEIEIDDASGVPLWSGPVALTDAVAGRPYGTMGVPGRDYGIQLLLDRDASGGSSAAGTAVLLVIPYRVVGANSDGTDRVQGGLPFAVPVGAAVAAPGLDITVRFPRVSAYTLLIAKQDPGAGIVWFAFLSLILGIAIVFYRPRRRVWARLEADGRLALAGRSDRYVDFDREFGRLLEDLVSRRRPSGTGG